jgi:TPR repeat protein
MGLGLVLMVSVSLLQAGLDAHGRGDFAAARAALKPLAAQGSAVAETLLGGMTARGQGVQADAAAAAAWWFRAANRGYAPAQLALARAMADGRGLAMDKGQAWLWATRAVGAGGAVGVEAAALAKRLEADVPAGERAALAGQIWVAWP